MQKFNPYQQQHHRRTKLINNKENYKISWSIIFSASAHNISKRCNLCLDEKLHVTKADKASNLNKRTEYISKCHHENKYSPMNLDLRILNNYSSSPNGP